MKAGAADSETNTCDSSLFNLNYSFTAPLTYTLLIQIIFSAKIQPFYHLILFPAALKYAMKFSDGRSWKGRL